MLPRLLLCGRNFVSACLDPAGCPLVAQSGHTDTDHYLSTFGVKRTCRELGRQIDRSQMTLVV
jgi:hypothetical protein